MITAIRIAIIAMFFSSFAMAEEKISIRGEVKSLDNGRGKIVGTMLVEGEIQKDTEVDKAMVRVTTETKIFKKKGKETVEAKWSDIAKGAKLEIWFKGPVAESYPVQANAGKILILSKD